MVVHAERLTSVFFAGKFPVSYQEWPMLSFLTTSFNPFGHLVITDSSRSLKYTNLLGEALP